MRFFLLLLITMEFSIVMVTCSLHTSPDGDVDDFLVNETIRPSSEMKTDEINNIEEIHFHVDVFLDVIIALVLLTFVFLCLWAKYCRHEETEEDLEVQHLLSPPVSSDTQSSRDSYSTSTF